jgi:hypothetical protein
MKFSLVKVIGVIGFLLGLLNSTMAQDGYRQLTGNDFRGIPHSTGDNCIALTYCSIDYHYHVTTEKNNYHLTFNVEVILDRERSWLDRKRIVSEQMMAEVLKHEQGHYTIAYMEREEILREANRTHFDANYQAEANALFNRIHAKYEQLNVNYDTDTRNMLDVVQQHSWDVYFQRRLAYMPPEERVGY